jgi:hypothetical protein
MIAARRIPRITRTLQLCPGDALRHRWYADRMCRSIRTLRSQHDAATTGEVEAAARQYVRKVSGFRVPSRANEPAFEQAVAEVARVTEALLATLVTRQPAAPPQP